MADRKPDPVTCMICTPKHFNNRFNGNTVLYLQCCLTVSTATACQEKPWPQIFHVPLFQASDVGPISHTHSKCPSS